MAVISVIGAGAWGTALSLVLARLGHQVYLYTNDLQDVAAMQRDQENKRYLPGFIFPSSLHVESDLPTVVQKADYVLMAVPSTAFDICLGEIAPFWTANHRFIWVTKGLNADGELLSTSVTKYLGRSVKKALISGPSFALETAKNAPTAVAVASSDTVYAAEVAALFNESQMRLYTLSDLIGAQLGGAIKNVFAIATGMTDGMKLGANTRAALMTRGLAEAIRLGQAMGAKMETFLGLTGVGDLILTCTDDLSRNRRYGFGLGKGALPEEIKASIGQVIEGELTTLHLYKLAKSKNVEMPLLEKMYEILYKNLPATQAIQSLLKRPQRAEF